MEHLSSDMEHQQDQQLQWRRDKVQELCSKGHIQRYSINAVGINSIVNRDLSVLRQPNISINVL
jgi:hypothetical protein